MTSHQVLASQMFFHNFVTESRPQISFYPRHTGDRTKLIAPAKNWSPCQESNGHRSYLGTRMRWKIIGHKPWSSYASKSPMYPLDRKVCAACSRSPRAGEEKALCLESKPAPCNVTSRYAVCCECWNKEVRLFTGGGTLINGYRNRQIQA